jgi:hypothetical protein
MAATLTCVQIRVKKCEKASAVEKELRADERRGMLG